MIQSWPPNENFAIGHRTDLFPLRKKGKHLVLSKERMFQR
jgi:hypothetical protein